MTIGEKIKETREAKGLTVEELAARSGMDAETIIKYESNKVKPKYNTLLKLSDVLDEDITTLFNEVLNKNSCISAAEQVFEDEPDEDIDDELDGGEEYEIVHEFAHALLLLREMTDLSQEELARGMSLTVEDIDAYENGKLIPDIVTVERFSEFFNVPREFLIGTCNIRGCDRLLVNFVIRIKILTELYEGGLLPAPLFNLCRKAVIEWFA